MTKGIKIYNGLSESENYEVNLNKICKSEEFKNYISNRHKVCPAGLTVGCYGNSETGFEFSPEIKHYGCEHTCNNGMEYSDMGDYTPGPAVTPEMRKSVFDYFKENDPEIWNVMKNTGIAL